MVNGNGNGPQMSTTLVKTLSWAAVGISVAVLITVFLVKDTPATIIVILGAFMPTISALIAYITLDNRKASDGRLTQLLANTEELARAQGKAEGIVQEQQRVKP